MGLSKAYETRFAFVSARSSAFCDEIVEVYPGEVDGDQGNKLCRIACGDCDAWIRVDWLEPPPRPIASPYPKAETRRIYRAMLGHTPPQRATAGLMWATVTRYLAKAEWGDFQAWWESFYPRAPTQRLRRGLNIKERSARSALPLRALGWGVGLPRHLGASPTGNQCGSRRGRR